MILPTLSRSFCLGTAFVGCTEWALDLLDLLILSTLLPSDVDILLNIAQDLA